MPNPSIVLDQVADSNGAELLRLSQFYPLPDFVKQADVQQLRPPEAVTVYADDAHRLYPCHNSASTYLSALFFNDKQAAYIAHYGQPKSASTQKQLQRFAAYWGIKAAVDELLSPKQVKNADEALPDSDFAYVWQGDNGCKQRHLRLKNAGEVKMAAQWLQQYRDTLPFADRYTVAGKIREKAAAYGAMLPADLDTLVEQQAGAGVCNPREVTAMIRQRAKLAAQADFKAEILKLAAAVENMPRLTLGPGTLVKLASTIDSIDRKLGLSGKYTDVIRRPEEVLFRCTYKEAKAAVSSACAMTTGNIYDASDFTKLSLDDIASVFGGDVAREVAEGLTVDPVKLAEFASTAPMPDAELFDKLCRQAEISPVHQKSASEHRGVLTPEMAEELAAAY